MACQDCPTLTVVPPPCNAPGQIPILAPGVPGVQVQPCQPGGPDQPPCCQYVAVNPVQQGTPVVICPSQKKKKCRYVQPARPTSYRPVRKFAPPELKMEDGTIYRKSYLPVEGDRMGAIRPVPNLCVGEGPFSKDTVNKMSFTAPKDFLPPCPILPCNHKLLGDGPMQDITTQRHDYVPKCQERRQKVRPMHNLYGSDCPLSDKTTNRLSYMPVDTKSAHVTPFRPVPALEKATGPFEKNTVHKMSYMPWEPQEKDDKPWAKKAVYQKPTLQMSNDTVNRLSFMPPGTYVECDDEDDPSCVDCPPGMSPKAAPTCAPCCCPKAAC